LSVLDTPPPLFRTEGSQFTFVEPAVVIPTMRVERIDGKLIDLSMFRGKVILVNVWATWCPPCARELPLLERLSDIVRSEPLEIVAVSIDASGRDVVKPFLKRLHIERLPIYLDPARHLAKNVGDDGTSPFVLYGMPMSYVVDRLGRIAGYLIGEADWSSADGLRLLRYYMAA
jgi:thiol-disulfide isomerase/thioredoxin